MAKESPLKEWHRANGAEFGEEDGWSLPLRFTDPVREYRAVRSEVGLLDLCHRGLLRFTGPDRIPYLQGMVSNDVNDLTEGKGTYAAILDIQGKILADARIFCTHDSFLLDLWESLREKILAHLHRYLIADEVEVTDLTGQCGLISLQGPKARPLLRGLLPQGELPSGELEHRTHRIGSAEVRFIRCTHTGEEGFDLLIPLGGLASVMSRIQELEKKFSLRCVGTEAQEILRVEAGILRYGIDMDENTLLLETGMDRAVSFQKGCYLGQEVVERIRSRGHVNKRLAGFVLEGQSPAEPGSPVRVGEKEIGKVTSSVFSPARRCPLALGYVHREYLEPGTQVSIRKNGQTIPARISSLPFYQPTS